MKKIIAFTLLCPTLHDGKQCGNIMISPNGEMPVFYSMTQAALIASNFPLPPIVQQIEITYEN